MDDVMIGCYGKLPLSPEFIRHHAAGIEMDELDEWFQAGMLYARAQLGSNWEAESAQAPLWNFLFVSKARNRFLVGVVAPSRDQAGREFPFFLFMRIDITRFSDAAWLAPLQSGAFLTDARRFIQHGWENSDLKTLRSRLEELSIPKLDAMIARDSYQQELRRRTMGEFWTALLGDFLHPRKYSLDAALRLNLASLRQQADQQPVQGLKFPLFPNAGDEVYDLPFWLDMSSHLIRPRDVRLLLWNRTPPKTAPCLMAWFGIPTEDLVLFMIRPEQTEWIDLASDHHQMQTGSDDHPQTDRRQLLDNPFLTLDAFLRTPTHVD